MGLKLYSWLILHFWVFVILCTRVHCVCSEVYVKFLQRPREFSNLTSATFAFKVLVDADEHNCNCTNQNQTANCKLDDHIPSDCENGQVFYTGLQDGDHTFEICTNGTHGAGCAHYNWTIDTVPPTANVTAVTSFTNAPNVSVNISFSEPCPGFGCSSTNSCNLLIDGAGQVIPTTLSILQPNLMYSLIVSLSSNVQYGQVALVMDTEFCTDKAGNRFTRTQNSTFYVNFDRRSGLVEMRTEVPEHLIQLKSRTRLVHATNNYRNLKYHLNFSEPILNSSAEVLNSLRTDQGSLIPINNGSTLDNRSFEFQVENISSIAIVTISLNSSLIITRRGTPVSPIEPFTFLYDTQRPDVKFTTSTTRRTTENSIQITIEFTKPVYNFTISSIDIYGGHLQRSGFKAVSNSTYDVKIQIDDHVLNVIVPDNAAEDIAGNKNLAAAVQVKHYPVPLISVVLSTTATSAFAATSLVAGLLTVSAASLQTIGPHSNPPSPTVYHAGNIFRILCHIQVFALSRWLSGALPVEFDEFARGLQWSIPYFNLPWESRHTQQDMLNSRSPPNSYSYGSKISDMVFFKNIQPEQEHLHVATPVSAPQESNPKNRSAKCEDPEDSEGWKDFKKSTFWLVVMGGSSILLHAIVLLILKLRKNKKNSDKQESYGVITLPRFGIFFILVSLPCIYEASAGLVKGGSPSGAAIGTLLMCIVSFLVLALFLFLIIGVASEKLLQYKEEVKEEVKEEGQRFRWYQDILQKVVGPDKNGQWTWMGQPQSVHLTILGPVFEDLRGPPPRYESSKITGGNPLKQLGGYNNSVDETKDAAPKQLGGSYTSIDEKRDAGENPPKQLSGGNTSVDEINDIGGNPPKQLGGGGDTSADETKNIGRNPPKQFGGDTSMDKTVDVGGNPLKQLGSDTSIDEPVDAGGNPLKQLGSDTSIDEPVDAGGNPLKQLGSDTSIDEAVDAGGNPPKQLGGNNTSIDETDAMGNPPKQLGGSDTSIVETVDAEGNPLKQLGGGDPSNDNARGNPLKLLGSNTSIDEIVDAGGNPPKQLGGDDTSIDETDAGGNLPKQLSGGDTSIVETMDAEGNPLKQLGRCDPSIDEKVDAERNLPKQLGGGDTSIDETYDAEGNPPKQFGCRDTFVEAPFIQKLFGIPRIYYMLLESVRRVSLGVSAGAYPDKCSTKIPTIVLLCMSSFQLFFLVLKKPFIKRSNQLVEIIAVCSEVGVFATNLVLIENYFSDEITKGIGIFMLILFLVAFLAQMITQCYALYVHIKQMDTKEGSFVFGLKTASFGFLLFFFPYKLIKDLGSDIPEELSGKGEIVDKLASNL